MNLVIPLLVTWLVAVSGARARMPAKEAPIAVAVSPTTCLAPCSVRIEVVIPQRSDNRWAVVELDGPTFRSSRIQLDGDQAPKRFTIPYTIFSPGDYKVTAILYNTAREVSRQVATLLVSEAHP